MWQTWAELLPLGLAIAASPFAIIPAILVLFTERPKAVAGGFLTGWAGGVLASTAVFVLVASALEGRDEPASWVAWTKVALGAALVGVGVWQWVRREPTDVTPKWMSSIDSLSPPAAARLGLLLSAANPKVLLLTAGAGLTIGAAELAAGAAAASVAFFTVLASATVLLPLAGYAIAGQSVLAPLGRVRDWLERHNAAVMAVVITAIGLILLIEGWSAR